MDYYLKFLFIFFFIFSDISWASINKNAQNGDLFKNDEDVSNTLKHAESLIDLYNDSLKGRLREQQITEAVKKTKHHPDFAPYYWWLHELHQAYISPINSNFGTNCQLAVKRLGEQIFKKSLIQFCTSKASFDIVKSLNSKTDPPAYLTSFLYENHHDADHALQTIIRLGSYYLTYHKDRIPSFLTHIQNNKIPVVKIQNSFSTTGQLVKNYLTEVRKQYKNEKLNQSFFKNKTEEIFSYSNILKKTEWEKIFTLAKTFSQNKDSKNANFLYEKILSSSPHQDILSDALFEMLWDYIQKSDFKTARDLTKKYQIESILDKYHSNKLTFWYAFILEKTEEKANAKKIYQRLSSMDPFSFYTIMSSKSQPGIINYLKPNPSPTLKPISIGEFKNVSSNLKRIWAWSKLHHKGFLLLEQDRLLQVNGQNKGELLLRSVRTIMSSGNNISAFNFIHQLVINKTVPLNREAIELMFPSPFDEEIMNLNPSIDVHVINALIRQESGFNPDARSRVGARGLMQIMPYTAKVLDRKIASVDIAKPHINLKLGTTFLRMMLDKFDNNLVYALAAYNAGPHRVLSWQKDYFNPDDSILVNIESIPFLETRNYVKLIFRNLYFYKTLRGDQLAKSDIQEYNKIYDLHLGFKH